MSIVVICGVLSIVYILNYIIWMVFCEGFCGVVDFFFVYVSDVFNFGWCLFGYFSMDFIYIEDMLMDVFFVFLVIFEYVL